MKEILWQWLAKIVSHPKIADYLIERSHKTPYFDLPGYMERDWLFNPYDLNHVPRIKWLPSIRIHHILRADLARHPHDHPWNARTILLRGDYTERRVIGFNGAEPIYQQYHREAGDTATINFGEYHSIDEVSDDGVFTLFFTFKYLGNWGFWVNGAKMPWQEYEEKYPENVSKVVVDTEGGD
jgi:hypothetical protein